MIAALGILKAAVGLLNWDRVLGALIGFGLSWCILAALNQAIWLPNAREDERNKLAAEALRKTIELIQSREKTNVEISAGDAASLCSNLLVSKDDIRKCVLGLAEADHDAGSSGVHRPD